MKYIINSVEKVYTQNRDLIISHGDERLERIQTNLDDIASDVRNNLQQLYRRGETFEVLDAKSEELKTSSKSLYKRARQVRM